jgi:hypothetical protein
LRKLGEDTVTQDIYQKYAEEFRRTALDFHIPIAQWHRPEVQYFVNFVNRAHQMHEDMLLALDDAAFYPKDENSAPTSEHIEGVDETHTLPNLDGVYRALQASMHIMDAVELIMRTGFEGNFIEYLSSIQDPINYAAKILVMPRDKAVLPFDEYGSS